MPLSPSLGFLNCSVVFSLNAQSFEVSKIYVTFSRKSSSLFFLAIVFIAAGSTFPCLSLPWSFIILKETIEAQKFNRKFLPWKKYDPGKEWQIPYRMKHHTSQKLCTAGFPLDAHIWRDSLARSTDVLRCLKKPKYLGTTDITNPLLQSCRCQTTLAPKHSAVKSQRHFR